MRDKRKMVYLITDISRIAFVNYNFRARVTRQTETRCGVAFTKVESANVLLKLINEMDNIERKEINVDEVENMRAECAVTSKCRRDDRGRYWMLYIIWRRGSYFTGVLRNAGLSSFPSPRTTRPTSLTQPFFIREIANEKADFVTKMHRAKSLSIYFLSNDRNTSTVCISGIVIGRRENRTNARLHLLGETHGRTRIYTRTRVWK